MIHSPVYKSYHLRINTSRATDEYIDRTRPAISLLKKINWVNYFSYGFLCASAFLLFTGLLAGNLQQIAESSLRPAFFLLMALLITLSCIHHFILVPRLFLKRAYTSYIIILIACFMMFAFTGCLLKPEQFVTLILPSGMLFAILAAASVIICQSRLLRISNSEIAKAKTAALRAQANPHFLFNALNWIYVLSSEASQKTPHAVIQLSGLMRYLLKDAHNEFALLKDELNYIKNYLLIQQGRFGNTVSLNCTVPVYSGNCKIAPLLAMPFIENAFKYGIHPNEDSVINVDIAVNNNQFSLRVINNKVSRIPTTVSNGTGINVARQRLNLLYPGKKHCLEIIDDNGIYAVNLLITLA